MSITLAHPFRIDSNGSAVTVEQGTLRHAAELAGHIMSTGAGERALAPLWGLIDPSGTQVDADELRATITYAEPALVVERLDVTRFPDGTVTADIDVDFADTDEEEAQ